MTDDEQLSRNQPVQEDMPMQRRVWRFERVGWYMLVLLVLLALAGLFGNGPLSRSEVTSADGRVKVEYQRFNRAGAMDSMRISVRGSGDGPVTVILGGSLFSEASIETMQPQPLASLSQGRALQLQLGTGGDGQATLYLTLRADAPGPLEGVVRAGPNSAVRFSSFVYP
ncbi:hypothetical protein [Pseudomonas putida]|uniref:Uncharacterized protein n=1 Tax=Pseudomonas putida TaxID=303 RepID=A0A1X0ZTA9_PSEPU|nr:hypothetical protein [Pseudomonas putida]ORL62953.1 hypothetical protein B7H17_16505 [Pseudomonas putida]